jgi:hypothetical protein
VIRDAPIAQAMTHYASEVHCFYTGMREPLEIVIPSQWDTKYWQRLFFICVEELTQSLLPRYCV